MVKIILVKFPNEWATTKQVCKDELVVYLSFSSHNIYIALLLCIEHCFTYVKILLFKYIYIYIYIYIYNKLNKSLLKIKVYTEGPVNWHSIQLTHVIYQSFRSTNSFNINIWIKYFFCLILQEVLASSL